MRERHRSPATPDDPERMMLAWAGAWLDDDRVGRLLLGGDGRLSWAAPEAEQFLAIDQPLGVRSGRLVARARYNQSSLDGLLARMAGGERSGGCLIAENREGAPGLYVEARALPDGRLAIQITDLGREHAGLPDLGRLFGLTRSEHETVVLLLGGLSVSAIAARLEKSVLTVRTHLKRAYGKLGVGTKEQLFAVVLRLVAR